jgi:4-carboxymuconolactone decarboxylase
VTTSRLPRLAPEEMSAEQRRVHDAIVAGPRGAVQGPLAVWHNSPDFAERAQALGAYCRYDSALPPRLSELAILTVGAFWKAGFEWHMHAPAGLKAGLDAEALEAIRTGGEPRFEREDEAAVHALCRELIAERRIGEPTFARAKALLGARGVVDLVGIVGYYTLISMTIVGFQVPLPEGAADPFADR